MKKTIYNLFVKRLLDLVLSGIALVVLSPILLLIAFMVKIKLGSPVIFKQERPGKGEKIFSLYKFRSMSNERDDNGNLLPDTMRLTKFGRLLRATSLDELPELINIVKGDMSIVGPRPLSVKYLPFYTNKEHHRHDVRPGLTGLAQVNGRNSLSWNSKFNYDLEYIKKLSFAYDVEIILLTVKKVFAREGIGQGEQHPGSLHEERENWLDENGNIKQEYQDDGLF